MHGCGHRTDFTVRHVRDGYQALLDDAPHDRDAALEADLAARDAAAGAWDGADRYWLDHVKHPGSELDRWSSGCCALPGPNQTACNCVFHAPPTDAPEARRFPSRCDSSDLVRSARGVDF